MAHDQEQGTTQGFISLSLSLLLENMTAKSYSLYPKSQADMAWSEVGSPDTGSQNTLHVPSGQELTLNIVNGGPGVVPSVTLSSPHFNPPNHLWGAGSLVFASQRWGE